MQALAIPDDDDFIAIHEPLFRALANRLYEDAGVRQEDVFVSLVHVPNENWSFGLGEAQIAEREPLW